MKLSQLLFFICVLFSQTLFAKDYNIVDFGAKPDGKTLNTTQIQAAIDAAHKKGGGRVVIPAGRFLSGMIHLKSKVELHLQEGAVLLGSTFPEDYGMTLSRVHFKGASYQNVFSYWKALVMADNQEDISITGKGEIDGQGRGLALYIDSLYFAGVIDSADYNFAEGRTKFYMRPQLISFITCKNASLKNVTLKNAACWVQTYDRCENLFIDSIRTDSEAYWNNDGIDILDCKNVRVTNSYFNTADDGICLKSHYWQIGCENIYVANCTVRSSSNAVKLGTMSYGGFRNITIENIRVYDTYRSAIAIESVDGGKLENVLVNNVQVENTGNAIFIRLEDRSPHSPAGTLKNVTIKNLKAEIAFERPDYDHELRGPAYAFFHNIFPASITGIPGFLAENITLENIEITYPGRGNNAMANLPLSRLDDVPEVISEYPEHHMFGELPAWGFYVRHVNGLTMKNIKLSIKAPDYRPAFVFDDVHGLNLNSIKIEGDSKPKGIILYKTEGAIIDNADPVLKM